MVKFRAEGAILAGNASGKQRNLECHSLQQGGEGAVHLIAETAAVLFHDLARAGVLVNHDFPAARDIQVLKRDRKSTRLNSSHVEISYAVFCLKKKNKTKSHHNHVF